MCPVFLRLDERIRWGAADAAPLSPSASTLSPPHPMQMSSKIPQLTVPSTSSTRIAVPLGPPSVIPAVT